MQAAFAVFRALPPPAAGTDILTLLHRTCAGLAADARESLVMQFVIRDVTGADVRPSLFFRPVYQRIDFKQAMLFIPLDAVHAVPGDGLAAAQPANPGIQPGKRAG